MVLFKECYDDLGKLVFHRFVTYKPCLGPLWLLSKTLLFSLSVSLYLVAGGFPKCSFFFFFLRMFLRMLSWNYRVVFSLILCVYFNIFIHVLSSLGPLILLIKSLPFTIFSCQFTSNICRNSFNSVVLVFFSSESPLTSVVG